MKRERVYVASSWRNLLQPAVVQALRSMGHVVYDFRNPAPGSSGFNWRDIDPKWQEWSPRQYRDALNHPVAMAGYEADITALRQSSVCVLVLPCGRSANWEFGYAMGQGKRGIVLQLSHEEPELMYREATICTSMDELFDAFDFGVRFWSELCDRIEASRRGENFTEEEVEAFFNLIDRRRKMKIRITYRKVTEDYRMVYEGTPASGSASVVFDEEKLLVMIAAADEAGKPDESKFLAEATALARAQPDVEVEIASKG